MHSEFSEWHHAAGLEREGDMLQKRWAAVDAFAVDREDVVSLVELFYGFFDGKDSFLAKFRNAFQGSDPSFRMRDNNRELSVLAGATLVMVMEEYTQEMGDLAALALVSCAAQNLRPTPCVADIPERAVRHISHRTVDRGKIESEGESVESQKVVMQLRRDIDVIGEESNILWWVFGETSRDTQKRWSECSVSQTALMAGKELADLTRVTPGPAAAGALLDRILKFAKTKCPAHVAVKDAIGDMPFGWKQEFAKNNCPPALAIIRPVSQGIKMSVDLIEGDAWVSAFASSTKMQRGGKIAPHLLAYQLFIECILASLWSKLS